MCSGEHGWIQVCSHAFGRPFVFSFVCTVMCSLIHLLIRSFGRAGIRSAFGAIVRSFSCVCILSLVHMFVRSLCGHLFVDAIARAVVWAFVQAFVQAFVPVCIRCRLCCRCPLMGGVLSCSCTDKWCTQCSCSFIISIGECYGFFVCCFMCVENAI